MEDINLDDLIDYFEDTTPNEDPKTTEPDTPENIKTDDSILEESEEGLEETPIKEEEPAEEVDIDGEQLKNYYKFLNEYGLIAPPSEDFEFDGSVEKFEEVLANTQKVITNTAYSNIWQSLPEDFKPLLEYAFAGGKSIQDYLKAYAPLEYDQADVNDPDTARKIMYQYYKETSNYSDEKIKKFIDKLEESDDFETEVAEALDELKELKKERQAKLIESAKEQERLEADRAKQQAELIRTTIEANKEFEGLRRDRLKGFILNPIVINGNNTTEFSATLSSIFSNPEHLVQLADIIADYNPKNGLNMNRLKKQAKTESTKSIKNLLASALDSRRPTGQSSTSPDDANFDWKNVI